MSNAKNNTKTTMPKITALAKSKPSIALSGLEPLAWILPLSANSRSLKYAAMNFARKVDSYAEIQSWRYRRICSFRADSQ